MSKLDAYQRAQVALLARRLRESRRFIQVLYGPRQVGKTTAVLQVLEKVRGPVHVAAADAQTGGDGVWIEQQWNAARLKLRQSRAASVVLVIDEIQKCISWSETVKKCWDEDTRNKAAVKVVLLGSSRLLLQQGLTESLAGRYETVFMGHWSLEEMRQAFGLDADRFVWFGGYPGAVSLASEEDRWKEYVRSSLIEASVARDILMMTRVDKPALMRRLFELGCLYSGRILSYNKIMGQLTDAGNTTTLAHYLELLDTAGLLAGLEKYTGGQLRRRSSSPKFQVYNTALINAQSDMSFAAVRQDPAAWGRLVESAVGAHLLNHARSTGMGVYYWRQGNDEVDFVLEKNGRTVGLEVKSGAEGKALGMKAFTTRFAPYKTYLIGNDGLSWQEFLTLSPDELF